MEERKVGGNVGWKRVKGVLPFAVLVVLAMIYSLSFFYANVDEAHQRKKQHASQQPVLEIDPITHKYVAK